jgi:predicted nucleotidyltransferase
MIHIDEQHLKIIKKILAKYPYTFYLFGSRATGHARKLSDLDLCFIENIPWSIRAHIEEDFEESDLPYTVDLFDWNLCDDDFRQMIKKDWVLLQ